MREGRCSRCVTTHPTAPATARTCDVCVGASLSSLSLVTDGNVHVRDSGVTEVIRAVRRAAIPVLRFTNVCSTLERNGNIATAFVKRIATERSGLQFQCLPLLLDIPGP